MRLVWHRLPPNGFNHELIWLAVSLATLAGSAVWIGFGLIWPRCPFLAITGFPCLTCGATRCTLAFLHGDLLSAWRWNPLAFAALCVVAIFDLYAVIVLVAGSPRLRMVDWTAPEKKTVRIAVIGLIALNWIYLLAHRGRY
ncbi:MAG: hypothetical protein DLM73_17560 [Chthoniobacterales bacterium]|nr:MAG: hypothetical protein DLM73_17560 [Chthoniobacterales bacterium]